MRLPRVRLTVFGLMVLIALLATFLGGTIYGMRLGRLSEEYRRRAVRHVQDEERAALVVRIYTEETAELKLRFAERVSKGELSEQAGQSALVKLTRRDRQAVQEWDRWVRFRRKYERAAVSPWLPVAPDPPEPEELALAFAQTVKAKDAYEATAIYQAAHFVESTKPGFLAKKPKVAPSGGRLTWTVTFTDPKTGATERVRSFFSERTVTEYSETLARGKPRL